MRRRPPGGMCKRTRNKTIKINRKNDTVVINTQRVDDISTYLFGGVLALYKGDMTVISRFELCYLDQPPQERYLVVVSVPVHSKIYEDVLLW
jgi:hypothetical protein